MITIRVISSTWLILVLVPLMIIGCQLGIGAQPAPTPPPSYAPASKYTNTTSYSGTTSNSAIGAGNYAGRLQDSKIASRLR